MRSARWSVPVRHDGAAASAADTDQSGNDKEHDRKTVGWTRVQRRPCRMDSSRRANACTSISFNLLFNDEMSSLMLEVTRLKSSVGSSTRPRRLVTVTNKTAAHSGTAQLTSSPQASTPQVLDAGSRADAAMRGTRPAHYGTRGRTFRHLLQFQRRRVNLLAQLRHRCGEPGVVRSIWANSRWI